MKTIIAILILVFIFQVSYSQEEVVTDTARTDSCSGKFRDVPFQGVIETGYSWGVGEWGHPVYRLNAIVAKRLPFYSIGIGTGFSVRTDRSQEQLEGIRFDYQVPIFLDNRLYITRNKVQPYISIGVGASFLAHNMLGDISLYLNGSAGVSWEISSGVALVIGIHYESYNVKYSTIHYTCYKYSNAIGPTIGVRL